MSSSWPIIRSPLQGTVVIYVMAMGRSTGVCMEACLCVWYYIIFTSTTL